jgi:hypothetical protein
MVPYAVEILRALGLPTADEYEMRTSSCTFEDGGDFRIEVPGVNSFATFRAVTRRARQNAVTVNRVTETVGIFRHAARELRDYVALAADEGVELVLSMGPRAVYDTSASRLSAHGSFVGYRLRGMDQVRRGVDDVLRGIDLGCRTFLVYDEGALQVLASARTEGLLPHEVRFKASAHLGYANPMSVSLLESLGADSINPIRDLPLPAVAALRRQVRVPLDLHTDNPPSSGGFIRTYEAPDLVRVARPVHLKTGNSALGRHGQLTDAEDGERMIDQASIVLETLERFGPELRQSAPTGDGPGLTLTGATPSSTAGDL